MWHLCNALTTLGPLEPHFGCQGTTRRSPIGGAGKRRTTKIRPKAVGGGIFGCYLNFDKCRPEVADDVVSSAAID